MLVKKKTKWQELDNPVNYYIKFKSKNVKNETVLIKIFGPFMDNLAAGIGCAVAIRTSLTLLKGLFIQENFKDIQYFREFKNLDLWSIGIVAIFLLFFTIMKVISVFKETYIVQRTEQVKTEAGVTVMNENQK